MGFYRNFFFFWGCLAFASSLACGEQEAVNCYDDIGDVNQDGTLTADDCLEAIRQEMSEPAPVGLACQTLETQDVIAEHHVLSCPPETTLVSANCSGRDRYGYPVVSPNPDDSLNSARCRCGAQCDHTMLLIRCCAPTH
mgnify:CR=1 FL=1